MINLVSSWLFQAIDSFVKWNPKVFFTTKSCQWKKWVSADALRASFTWICSSCWHLAQGVEELNGSWIWGHQVWKTAIWNRTFAGSCQPTDQIIPKSFKIYFSKKQNIVPVVPVRKISGLHLLVEAHVVLHQLVYCDPRAARWSVANRDGWETNHFQMNGHKYSYGIHVHLFSYLFTRFCDWKWVSGIWFI